MSEALATRVHVDADPFPQDQLHVGRVAELHHGSHGEVDPLLRPGAAAAQLGTLVHSGVPRRLGFHLRQEFG